MAIYAILTVYVLRQNSNQPVNGDVDEPIWPRNKHVYESIKLETYWSQVRHAAIPFLFNLALAHSTNG